GPGGRRGVVDLPTATEPATPITNGTFVSSVPRKFCCARNRRCVAATYIERSRDSGREISSTSAMSRRAGRGRRPAPPPPLGGLRVWGPLSPPFPPPHIPEG